MQGMGKEESWVGGDPHMSPTQGVLCQEQGLRGMGPSPGQEFLVLNIIQVFPSALEAHSPSHLGQPLRELAAPPTAQRGCHLLERLRQDPAGRTWGAAASLGQKQTADCFWVPRNNFLASHGSLRGASSAIQAPLQRGRPTH